MNILKTVKEFLFPKKYSGLEIYEMGKNIKIDYTPDIIDLIANSTKLTDDEKEQTINNIVEAATSAGGRLFSRFDYLFFKSRL